MPEVLGNPPSPRTALFWNGTAWQWARVNAAGRLIVRGEDQLFSFQEVLHHTTSAVISGADGFIDTTAVGPGVAWVVTTMAARDDTSPVTAMLARAGPPAPTCDFWHEIRAFAIGDRGTWSGHLYLGAGDQVRAHFAGGLVGDSCTINLNGYIMTRE